jgi:hypothetical protein
MTDDGLLQEVKRLVANERTATAALLRSLIELDARRLYLREGCSSLFTYCTQVLHLAESAAYNRIEAARAARRFPVVLDAIADGALTLTSARLLAPHLMEENHRALLDAARYKSKRDVELLIASLYPKPAVPSILRKLPTVPPPLGSLVPRPPATKSGAEPLSFAGVSAQTPPESEDVPILGSANPAWSQSPRRAGGQTTPLSATTYKLQVTISRDTHDKLRRAQDLLRHAVPDGNLATVLDRALTGLVADLERRRCAVVAVPRESPIAAERVRHIPAAVRREIWRRDGGRCAFAARGRRCTETAFLEFHHVEPYATGGASTVANIELRCRAHNQYEATLFFGAGSETVREALERPW